MNRQTLPYRFGLMLLAVCILVMPLRIAAAQDTKLLGHWEGAIQLPGTPLAISVDFAAKSGGGLNATISIPAQGAKDLALSDVAQTDAAIEFKIPGIPGNPGFKGTLAADGAKISGTFTQGAGT